MNKTTGIAYFAVLEEVVQNVNLFGPFVQLKADLSSATILPVDKKKKVVEHIRDSLLTFQYNVQGHWTIISHGTGILYSEFAQKFDMLKGQRPDCVFEL